jgi:hypothetical protein
VKVRRPGFSWLLMKRSWSEDITKSGEFILQLNN